MEIIDLSQDIYPGMPVYKTLPQVKMSIHNTHEEWDGIPANGEGTVSVHKIEMGEHTGTHVDAINHMSIEHVGKSIDLMPLDMFYTLGICLDFRSKGLKELITREEIKEAIESEGLNSIKGMTVLLCTDHYHKHFNTENWPSGPGITAEATRWLGNEGVPSFGVETMSPGVSGISNREVHKVCGKLNFTHYENLINLDQLLGRGVFRFIGLPLKIKDGTGSPVRAVAVFE